MMRWSRIAGGSHDDALRDIPHATAATIRRSLALSAPRRLTERSTLCNSFVMSQPLSLFAYRRDMSLTLEQAGAKFGVDKTTFMRWEAGAIPPKRVAEVSFVTGVPMHVLRPDVFPAPKSQQARAGAAA